MAKAKYAVDDQVRFKGYSEEIPETEQLLIEGEEYTVVEVNEPGKSVAVEVDNPDFNSKKKVSEDNPDKLIVDVFYDEIEPASSEEEEAEEAPPAKTKAAPAKAPAKAAAKPAAKTPAKKAAEPVAEEEAEAAPAKKSPAKAAAKTPAKAPVKGKATAKPAAKPKLKEKAPKEEAAEDFTDLTEEQESEEVLALIADADDINDLAVELSEQAVTIDKQLGGVLYHVRKDKTYLELDERYAQKGGIGVKSGFELFVNEKLGMEYRKAMHLINIYYTFRKFGVDDDKVAEIGWTKCSKIVSVMTADNADDLIELAEQSSVSELQASIKETYANVGGTKGEKRRKVIFKFRLWEDQAAGVEETINAVAAQMGFKDLSDAFEHIVMEWAAEHPLEEAKPAKAATKAAAKAPAKATARAGK